MDVMALRRGLLAQMATVSDDKHLECGDFTLSEETRVYTINHSLGAVPDFCIVYPINVPATSNAYRIGWQVLIGDIGQQDWNVSTRTVTNGAWHIVQQGTNYSAGADAAQVGHNNAVTVQGVDYAGVATTTTIVVGGTNQNNGSGTLLPGKYGYIIGKLNA